MTTEHERRPAPGPHPSPIPGVCGVCGNTGLVHGPGRNGNWTDEPCDCETDTCTACGDPWPCVISTGDAWSVPKIPHDEDELVTPNIHGPWIYRAAGQSDAEHTRRYAAQLLAAADELERRQAAGPGGAA